MTDPSLKRLPAFLRSLSGPSIAFILPLAVISWFLLNPELDPELGSVEAGFFALSIAAMLSGICAIAVGVSGIRLRNLQILCLSAAFITPPFVLALHGPNLSGALADAGRTIGTVGPAASLSILASAFWLFISSIPPDAPVVRFLAGTPGWVLPGWVLLLILLNVISLGRPELFETIPATPGPEYHGLSIGVFVLLAMAWRNYWHSWRYSRFPLERAILYTISFLLSAQIAGGLTEPWHLSWWAVHVVLLAAALTAFSGLLLQFRGGAGLETMFSGELYSRLVYGISESVRALILATEARDRYTAGHNLRVALYALRLAQALNLPPEQQRAIAHGGVIHDVGKIALADSILNKPSALTDDEYAEVRQHPVIGFEIGTHLGMNRTELAVIRHHHERYDGGGYPDGIAGDAIPRAARIVAVADVFDALTSKRAYRDAWTTDRADSLIRKNSGSQFDPICVAAWQSIPEKDRRQIAAISGFTAG